MGTQWKYITPKDLHSLIKSTTPGKDYLVVDVRDEDFIGGNVKGCLHAPFQRYESELPGFIIKVKDIPTVIFHCPIKITIAHIRHARGPKSARLYAEKRISLADDPDKLVEQQILVLQGGFASLQAVYKDDPDVIEKWDKSVWEYAFM
ncbi:hypothetical protein BU17DRAFT_67284 [Hysterangium stoloniferum]|nr:hypothetical protein BU17DRAFT_67284 [Hysterangium stoloniferum]